MSLGSRGKSRVNASSICIRHSLIQLKIFHRLHLSRSRLAKLYANIDPIWVRCHQTEVTLSHMFWSYTRLSSFYLWWHLLCLQEKDQPQSNHGNIWSLVGRGHILSKSSKNGCFCHTSCQEINSCKVEKCWLEKVVANLKQEKGCTNKFYNVWQPFMQYFCEEHSL